MEKKSVLPTTGLVVPFDRDVMLALDGKAKFCLDKKDRGQGIGWFKQDYDDSKWGDINIGDGWRQQGYDYNGLAWYRMYFKLPHKRPRGKVMLFFGSVHEEAWVYLNGKLVGEHSHKSTGLSLTTLWEKPFEVNITNVVSRSDENLLAVRVSAKKGGGGIYERVWITIPKTVSKKEKEVLMKKREKEIFGQSAPDWLQKAEVGSWNHSVGYPEIFHASKVDFEGQTGGEANFQNLLRLGIPASEHINLSFGHFGICNPHKAAGINLMEHPEFINIDHAGNFRRSSFWNSEDCPNMYDICPGAEGFAEAVCRQIAKLMKSGVMGLFLDSCSLQSPCYGEKFKRHKHFSDDPIKNIQHLMKMIRETVKSFGADNFIMANGGIHPLGIYTPYADAFMWEGFVFNRISPKRFGGGTWKDIYHRACDRERFNRAGKRIFVHICLLRNSKTERPDTYFSYAFAKIFNFIVELYTTPSGQVLNSVRLGQPLTSSHEKVRGLLVRNFEHGVVVVNPTKNRIASVIPMEKDTTLFDLHDSKKLTRHKNGVRIIVPADSGRVYLNIADPGTVVKNMGKNLVRLNPYPLLIETNPPMGRIKFKIDGQPMWTHGGSFEDKFVYHGNFGQFVVSFQQHGKHTVEIVDIEAQPLPRRISYGKEDPNQLMDPANPTKPMKKGKKWIFTGWTGTVCETDHIVEVQVPGKLTKSLKALKESDGLTLPEGMAVTKLVARFKLIDDREK